MSVEQFAPETMIFPDTNLNPQHADAECDWCESRNNVSYNAKVRRNLCEDCWDEAERDIGADGF
jgi:hypothetical protein